MEEGADDQDEEDQQCIQDVEVPLIAGQSAVSALAELDQSAATCQKEVRQYFANNKCSTLQHIYAAEESINLQKH